MKLFLILKRLYLELRLTQMDNFFMGATQCIPSISFITKYKENKKNINYSHYYKFNDSQKIGANFLSNMATSQQGKNSREVTIVAAQLLVRYCQSDVNLGPSFGIISLYIQRGTLTIGSKKSRIR